MRGLCGLLCRMRLGLGCSLRLGRCCGYCCGVVGISDDCVFVVLTVVGVVVVVRDVLTVAEVVSVDVAVLVCVVGFVGTVVVSVVVGVVLVIVVVTVVSSGLRFRYTFRDAASSPLAVLNPSRQVPDVISFSSGIPRTMQPSSVRSSV